MSDPATPTDRSVDRRDQGEDRPPHSRPGSALSFPISLIASCHSSERIGSLLRHPSVASRVMRVRGGGGKQASVPQAGSQARSEGVARMDDWRTQEVLNEIDARRRNEWIEESNDRYGAHDVADDYVCECSDAGCTELITLTRDEYESVRRFGARFAIAVDHENPEIDRVIGQNGRFSLVEKWFGFPRRMAHEANPRR